MNVALFYSNNNLFLYYSNLNIKPKEIASKNQAAKAIEKNATLYNSKGELVGPGSGPSFLEILTVGLCARGFIPVLFILFFGGVAWLIFIEVHSITSMSSDDFEYLGYSCEISSVEHTPYVYRGCEGEVTSNPGHAPTCHSDNGFADYCYDSYQSYFIFNHTSEYFMKVIQRILGGKEDG